MSKGTRARRTPAVLALALIATALLGCGSSAQGGSSPAPLTPYLRQLVDAARREGALDLIYSSSDTTDEISAWEDGFRRYYGLDIRITNTANPVMPSNATTVIEEHRAQHPASTDVYFGVGIFALLLERQGAALTGALRDLPNLAGLTEDGDSTVQLAALPSGITYASDRVSQVPRSLDDVLREPGSVHIASSPYAGTLAALPEYWGPDRAIQYSVRLAAKIKGLFGCGEESRLVSGEFDMFVTDCGDNAGRRLAAKGAHIAEVFPTDGSFLNEWYLTIPSNSAHPNAARLWINYLLSRQAQDILWQDELVDNHRVAGSHVAALIAADERNGVSFHDTDMASARAAEPFTGASNCIQAILNNQAEDPSCSPYRTSIAAAQ